MTATRLEFDWSYQLKANRDEVSRAHQRLYLVEEELERMRLVLDRLLKRRDPDRDRGSAARERARLRRAPTDGLILSE